MVGGKYCLSEAVCLHCASKNIGLINEAVTSGRLGCAL